ncbi:hypothetical protein OIU84_029747 [Salix udensis]|uniref:Uncharacterized protein n=1 Tax=Salix udensis TaxID=889485 RepID=A0AAD6KBI0_9ROSI|nr:hypothetical protein OIU84_029747 [Salix udensis]
MAASLVNVGLQDPMAFEASVVAHARQPVSKKLTSKWQPDPMISEAAADFHDWQPVPKKHTSNRQPKSGLGISASLVPGTVIVASKGKAVEAAGNESVDNGLMALGSFAAGSTMVEAVGNVPGGTGLKVLSMGCAGLGGKPVGAAPQAFQ